jgi:hypothetical protein
MFAFRRTLVHCIAIAAIAAAGVSAATTTRTRDDSLRVRVAYYHGTIRCQNCLMIEEFAASTMHAVFADELRRGVVSWDVIDYEAAKDSATPRRYGIDNQALIVSRIENGKEVSWRKLTKAWNLVENYRRFQEYLKGNVREMMRGR